MTKPCIPGLFGRPHPHDYRARYTEELQPHELRGVPAPWLAETVSAHKTLKYNGDVCARCGDVINVPQAKP